MIAHDRILKPFPQKLKRLEDKLTEHQKLLHAVLHGLDESARIAFLKETFGSLPSAQRQEIMRVFALQTEPQDADVASPVQIDPISAVSSWQAPAALDVQETNKPAHGEADMLPASIDGLDPIKDKKVMSALKQLELLKDTEQGNGKKVLRKEAISCLGLGLLGLTVLVIASVGLKYLWQLLFP